MIDKHKPACFSLLSMLIAALAGCNGSSSTTTTTPTTTPAPADTTAPTVSSTSPAAAATGVARNSTVTATFDEDIFASTVDGTSFTLAAGGSTAGTVSFDGATNVATFTPTNPLAMLATYTATLTTAITDLAGNVLASNHSWSFTTADGAWGTAALIETDNTGSAFIPKTAVDSNGNAVAVWYQSDGTRYNIWANRYVAGSGWGTAEMIETDNGTASSPAVGVDANGNAIAVWHQYDGTRNNIWANRYVAGSGWGTAALIETDNAGTAQGSQVAVDANGNTIAVWHQYDGTRYNIVANRYVAGSGWGTPELIETDNADSALVPQIAVDANGNAMAVWEQSDGTRYNIWANRYVVGSGWGTAALIETDNAGHATTAQVALDASGNAVAVWQQTDGTRYNIWANRYAVGTGWGTAELIETDNAGNANFAKVGADANGNAIAVWRQHNGTRYDILANRYVAGSGWGTAEVIDTDNVGSTESPNVAVDANGNAHAVWNQFDGTTRWNIWANRYVAGTGWGTPALIETIDTGTTAQPHLAVNANGNAAAVWIDHDGARYNITANVFE